MSTSSKGVPLLQVIKDGWFEEIQQLWTGKGPPSHIASCSFMLLFGSLSGTRGYAGAYGPDLLDPPLTRTPRPLYLQQAV